MCDDARAALWKLGINCSMRRRSCSAVITPFASSSSCMARLMISCSDGGPSSNERSREWS